MSINELVHGKSKQNKDYTKRDILIRDRTGQITVTLWYQTVGPCRLKSSSPFESDRSGGQFSNVSDSNGDHAQRSLCQRFQRE